MASFCPCAVPFLGLSEVDPKVLCRSTGELAWFLPRLAWQHTWLLQNEAFLWGSAPEELSLGGEKGRTALQL